MLQATWPQNPRLPTRPKHQNKRKCPARSKKNKSHKTFQKAFRRNLSNNYTHA